MPTPNASNPTSSPEPSPPSHPNSSDPPSPVEDPPSKTSIFSRFKKPHLPLSHIRKAKPPPSPPSPSPPSPSPPSPFPPSPSPPSPSLPSDIHPPVPDAPPLPPSAAAKAARRAARRADRTRREEEWEEQNHRRRNDAILTGLPMQHLPQLPDFDSASEDEQRGPFIPPSPAHLQHGPHVQPTPGPHLPHMSHQPPAPPQADTHAADLFGAQAFTGTPSSVAPTFPSLAPRPDPVPDPLVAPTQPPPTRSPSVPSRPKPIGWGGVYDSIPSQPLYGTPTHLNPPSSAAGFAVEPVLADKIRRGRELGLLAIEQEERGNLGAAEAGYMKALALLIPASKDLDIGSELNKNARMVQKGKIQREAAAMLDRCEELNLFLKANGPVVPNELPIMPSKYASPGPPKRDPPPPPLKKPNVSLLHPSKPTSNPKDLPTSFLPPPPPPPPNIEDPHSELFQRIESRKNVVLAASNAASGSTSPSLKKKDASIAKCFMCNASADLKTKCQHTFCSNCGNQAVSVFEQCPVPNCNQTITVEGFQHILS